MSDRRRINGPAGGTTPPVFSSTLLRDTTPLKQRPGHSKEPNDLKKIFLKTGLTPSASGSAYLELEGASEVDKSGASLATPSPTIKLTCTVHGPRPLPRSAPFSPNVLLSTHVKFAPFAAKQRRGYIRDSSERDLAVHLESALRGVLIGERWPKSGVDVVVTILEGQEDSLNNGTGDEEVKAHGCSGAPGMMSILAGCITVASAAIVDAGLDCVDLVTGGVAAIVRQSLDSKTILRPNGGGLPTQVVLDPATCPGTDVMACCVLGYLKSRDEITQLWIRGGIPTSGPGEQDIVESLIDGAVRAAVAARLVLVDAVKEATMLRLPTASPRPDEA